MDARPKVPLRDCRDCTMPICFARLDTGNVIPLNPAPNPKGNVACRIQGGRLVGFVVSRDHQPGPFDRWRMTAHAATCEARKTTPKPPPADEPLF